MLTLCGSMLKMSSFGFTRACSVNEVDLESVKDTALPPPPPVQGYFQPTVGAPN